MQILKKFFLISCLLATMMALSGCANTKIIDGVRYDVFGLANITEKQNPNVEYRLSFESIVVAVIFSETIVVPLYVVFYDLWEPVGPRTEIKGQIPN